MAKQVLVRVGENSRPVTIKPGDLSDVERLKQWIYKCFNDVLKVHASESILMQIKSKFWNGEFVDTEDPATMIPDKCCQSQNLAGISNLFKKSVVDGIFIICF